ncbi:4-alpha-glucanotransferase [Acetitomaculum ruminis DSM 5522]|uniref:4-alpha-glucanotransferase n=1 Tax=Acetitomaculum ruminis DSM 5522 TaxID=1120918 RepID=A0A1I0WZE7_9FIRM|nr:4-alpha-glucanotransferase [Acetitomaculum ruminis]SFA93466.1 4-alpha-glucanotransferase [Acetitomaculum ruminis DSM 5522]
MRTVGVLLPVFSLPSKYGIGCFSKEAYDFVDKLNIGKQKIWQILPLCTPDFWGSPYQSCSTFAGNPYHIDLETLIKDGLLTEKECDEIYDKAIKEKGDENIVATKSNYLDEYVNYAVIEYSRKILLKLAYDSFKQVGDGMNSYEIRKFKEENNWVDEYALYMALKDHFDHKAWNEWPGDIKNHKPESVDKYKTELENEINYYIFIQYEFFKQWKALKKYANDKGIQILGDLPIYVSMDSCDVWSETEFFDFDQDNKPRAVAGCPPDDFSKDGQLWGNPLYNWDKIKENGYGWWIRRFDYALKMYDIIRIDHFRGFDEYFAIPYESKTAQNGKWKKGPGIELFKIINQWFGNPMVIAEDLGFLTDGVRKLLADTNYPGMKVIEFAFSPNRDSIYLPLFYERNHVVYTGTHDNNTVIGWFKSLDDDMQEYVLRYCGLNNLQFRDDDEKCKTVCDNIITLALSSTAETAIIQMQDYLKVNEEGRINEPGTIEKNWKWRMKKGSFTEEIAKEMAELTRTFCR